VYKARAVNNPANRKCFVLLEFIPLTKNRSEAIKKQRKVASLNPDLEKKRKYSVVTNNIIL
jgi:nitrogenase subunit NifH